MKQKQRLYSDGIKLNRVNQGVEYLKQELPDGAARDFIEKIMDS